MHVFFYPNRRISPFTWISLWFIAKTTHFKLIVCHPTAFYRKMHESNNKQKTTNFIQRKKNISKNNSKRQRPKKMKFKNENN